MHFASKALITVIAAASLSGCAAVELANLVYTATDMNIGYTADADVARVPNKHVYAESFHTTAAYGDPCYTDGVVVDYSANTNGGEPVATQALDPEKVYGQAVIFYKQACGLGDKVESIDVVRTGSRRQIFGEPMAMKAGEKVVVYDYYPKNNAHRPDWMPQVLKTIQAQADAGDKDAQLFLAYLHIENGEPVTAAMGASK